MTSFRWAILGTGFAARKFVLGLRAAREAEALVVASRTRANADRFASDLGIPKVADTYSAAIAAPVDAVYIATPPSEHLAQALLCLDAGKPMLIEKPLSVDAASAEKIVAAARTAGIFCMEGMWNRFVPLMRQLDTILQNGDIGEPLATMGSFGARTSPDHSATLFSEALGGGALLHRGVYPLSLSCQVLGYPDSIASQAVIGPSGVDETTSVSLRHSGAGLSSVYASLRNDAPNDFRIMGSEGTIHILPPVYRPFRLVVTRGHPLERRSIPRGRWAGWQERTLAQSLQQRLGPLARHLGRSKSNSVTLRYGGNGYHYEAEEVMRCIRCGETESAVMPHADSLATLRVVDEARAQWPSGSRQETRTAKR